jgi:hypothetical protein
MLAPTISESSSAAPSGRSWRNLAPLCGAFSQVRMLPPAGNISFIFQLLIEQLGAPGKPHLADEKWCSAITRPIVFTHTEFEMKLPATWWSGVSQEG